MTIKRKSDMFNAVAIAATVAAAIAFGWHMPSLYYGLVGTGHDRKGDFAEHVARQRHPLTLYGTTTCPACMQAREHLRKLGTPFNDQVIDQSQDAKRMYDRLGERSVPILVTNAELLIGFNASAYDKLARFTSSTPKAEQK